MLNGAIDLAVQGIQRGVAEQAVSGMRVDAGFAGVGGSQGGLSGAEDMPDVAIGEIANPVGFVGEADITDDEAVGSVGEVGDAALEDESPKILADAVAAPLGAEGLHEMAGAAAKPGNVGLLVVIQIVGADAEADFEHVADSPGVGELHEAVLFDQAAGDGVLAVTGGAGDADDEGVGHGVGFRWLRLASIWRNRASMPCSISRWRRCWWGVRRGGVRVGFAEGGGGVVEGDVEGTV